jgi:isopentenyldiphosphate isomerase
LSERIEVYTPDGRPTGVVKSRAAIHESGDWHLAAFVWVFDPAGRILLQRRAPDKDAWPGRWDASAAGHVEAGETSEEAARRELAEELGIRATSLLRGDDHRQEHVHPGGLVDREHHAVFFLACDLALGAYAPGPEVTAIGLVALAAFEAFARGAAPFLPIEVADGVVNVPASEIVPYAPGYLATIARCVAARTTP